MTRQRKKQKDNKGGKIQRGGGREKSIGKNDNQQIKREMSNAARYANLPFVEQYVGQF